MSHPSNLPHYFIRSLISHVLMDNSQDDLIEKVAQQFVSSLKPEIRQSLNGRLERGLAFAKSGAVSPLAEADHPRAFLVRSSDGTQHYRVDLDTKSCECPDSRKGNTCKHRIAAYYIEQAGLLKPVPMPKAPPSPHAEKSEAQLLKELGFEPEDTPQPVGAPRLGMLYRRYLHGEDLMGKTFTVEIIQITKERLVPHPNFPPAEKYCLWVEGLPEGLPNGVLFGAAGEKNLIAIFGPVSLDSLKGKQVVLVPQPMMVAGQRKVAIRFRGVV